MEELSAAELRKLNLLGIEHAKGFEKENLDIELSGRYKSEDVLVSKNKEVIIKSAFNLFASEVKEKIGGRVILLIDDVTFDKLNDFMISENAKNVEILKEANEENVEEFELDNTEISKIINNILNSAKNKNVSDVHVCPKEDKTEIKFRENGQLKIAQIHPKHYSGYIVNKLKNEARMDISNKITPQDGKLKIVVENEVLELRINTLPTVYGENSVIRIQKPEAVENRKLETSGFEPEDLERYRSKFKESNGLILNVGGTGTGKSTTFAVTIAELIKYFPYKNIITVEDPVEMKNPSITQIEVNDKQGRTFAVVLRSLMRQDPDIILIGEIRDNETAEIGVQSALTGHLVLATLHANDSFDAITRLRQMGVENQIIASTASCFLSQVLVMKLCPHCRKKETIPASLVSDFQLPFKESYIPVGCNRCDGGFTQREASIEVLVIDEDIKQAISSGMSSVDIKKVMKKKGFTNLWDNTLKKVERGETTLNELLTKVKRDVIFNFKRDEDNIIDTRIIFYPDIKVKAKVNNKSCHVFDISKKGLSLLFETATFLNIGEPLEVEIEEDVFVDFIPKGYGKMGERFLVSGIYKGDLKKYIEG